MGANSSNRSRDHRDLQVFQRARVLAGEIIRVTETFPKSEIHGSVSQMRRASISITSNIAEGYRRCSIKEYIKFLKIAYGSCGELDSQITISHDVGWINDSDFENLDRMVNEVSRWIWRLMKSMNGKMDNRING